MSRDERPNLRTAVIRAAEDADVDLSDYDRAIVLGQLAELIGKHHKVGGKIAFKGGAVMNLVDGSPRLSRDLDGDMVSGGAITEEIIREALGTTEARRIVKRVDRFTGGDPDSLRFPVIVCHPISGKGEVEVSMSIHWDAPLVLQPVRTSVEIHGRTLSLLVMARPERLAEKVRAFVSRGFDRDAYDMYHSWKVHGVDATEKKLLAELVPEKIRRDPYLPDGMDLHGAFDEHVRTMPGRWGTTGYLVLPRGSLPDWDSVCPYVVAFKRFLPKVK